ncbi:MAG TPA: GspH/FimT family pseudopilin [Candidatus Methylomirabilis sp.]|nr:GspH/FimT family pseudopilin [Candidatus Methylomirabilis sp.]
MRRHNLASAVSFSGVKSRLIQAGYTLHELLITSIIAGALGTGAVSFIGLMQDTRMATAVNSMMGDLALARSAAITRNAMVTLCKSRDGVSCTDDSAWHEGWLVFADDNNNHDVDSGEMILHVQERLAGDMKLRYGETGGYHYVRYNSTGEAWPGATFTFCDGRGTQNAKAVVVYWSGRPRVSVKTAEGKPLRCS